MKSFLSWINEWSIQKISDFIVEGGHVFDGGSDPIKKEYIKVLKEQNDGDFEYYIEILLKGRGCLSWGHWFVPSKV